MKTIETSGYILEIYERGNLVRQYHDVDHKRFKEESSRITQDHMSKLREDSNMNFKIHQY